MGINDQVVLQYQSRTSRIFGFPSEVTCNPAAAGSTPESGEKQHFKIRYTIQHNARDKHPQRSTLLSFSMNNISRHHGKKLKVHV